MATLSFFTISSKTLTPPNHPKTSSLNFKNLSIRTKIRTRNPIQIRAAAKEDFSSNKSGSNEQKETIMLPGCDYNHWLIVMEFPKDPKPSREQMIDTYLQTLATVLGSLAFGRKMQNLSSLVRCSMKCPNRIPFVAKLAVREEFDLVDVNSSTKLRNVYCLSTVDDDKGLGPTVPSQIEISDIVNG